MKKYQFFVLASFCLLFLGIALILGYGLSSKPLTEDQTTQLSQSVDRLFTKKIAEQKKKQAKANSINNTTDKVADGNTIMAIIYKKPNATWFIKAKSQISLMNQQAKTFSQLFLQELKFNNNHIPDFSHIPKEYQWSSQQAMRFASFNLNGVDVSVTQLGPNQDVTSNVNRWKGQLGLANDAPGFVKYQDNDQTVLIRLDSIPVQSQTPRSESQKVKPPEKENLKDFIQLNLSSKWQQLAVNQGMASGTLVLTEADKKYEVAILRLPSQVALETVFGIWKQRMGLTSDVKTESTELLSDSGQIWQLTPLSNQKQTILVATYKGETKYTFMRLSSQSGLVDPAKKEFIALLKTSKVIKP